MKYPMHVLCISLFFLATAPASNLQRERLIADQIINNLQDGKAIWLGEQNNPFLALQIPSATSYTLGGVILLHDMGANPDTKAVIQPLRVSLANRGWETLSIQLPIASQSADDDAYSPMIYEAGLRIQTAVDYFESNQNKNLVLVGHGLGAKAGLFYLTESPAREVRALVAIGLAAETTADGNPILEAISKIRVPMLDLFGSRDLDEVKQSADLRRKAANRSGLSDFRQDRVTGAGHDFLGLEDTLQIRVGAWIGKVAAGKITADRGSG